MTRVEFPPLPYADWEQTKTTLHLYTQIVGKVRLALHPHVNHWWHVPLYVSPRGLTTSSIPHAGDNFELEFDFFDHELAVRSSRGVEKRVPLAGNTVAGFYAGTMAALAACGVEPGIRAQPFDSSKTTSDIPFAKDTTHGTYDGSAVERYWRVLVGIDGIFREFRGAFRGKCSPVHMFWHSFDLAVTRFSGRPAPVAPDADSVTREAYCAEVVSAGFWPGDTNMPEAAFYVYAAPEPDGLAAERIAPAEAWWQDLGSSHMGLYRYDDFRTAADPRESLLAFLQSTYDAAARRGRWPAELAG